MDVASGVTISQCYRRHRQQEFLRFLNDIDANLPRGLEVHLVMDNYGTHKVSKVRTWLARHPRYHVHFTPTSASWLNLVERLFAEVTLRSQAAFHQFDHWGVILEDRIVAAPRPDNRIESLRALVATLRYIELRQQPIARPRNDAIPSDVFPERK
jgi:hypothetical protein